MIITIIQIPYFSIEQISESGQCFRLNRIGEHRYSLIAKDRYLEIEQKGDLVQFFCSFQEYEEIWKTYFDLERNYQNFVNAIPTKDNYLSCAVQFGRGVRILNQDLWEMIISFIISQQNNIKRIKRCIELLSVKYGEKKLTENGIQYYTFPTVQALANASEEELKLCNLGYRSSYIQKTTQSILHGEVDLEKIRNNDYETAKAELMKLCGVGIKVAECICLFGLHHLNAFPVDTHIKKVLEQHYPNGFPFETYTDFAGVINQYLFYYDLKSVI